MYTRQEIQDAVMQIYLEQLDGPITEFLEGISYDQTEQLINLIEQNRLNTITLNKCNHPEHNPPKYLHIPPGKGLYICPGCGNKNILKPIVLDSYRKRNKK